MSRYESKNIKLGSAFKVGQNQDQLKKSQFEQQAELIISDAKAQAEKIISDARLEGESIIGEARANAEKINSELNARVEEAIQQGTQQGIGQGFQQITEEMKNKVLMVDEFAKVNFEIKKKIIKSAHINIIQLLTEISRKLALFNIENKEFLTKLIMEGIDKLPEKEFVTVIINPKLAEQIYEISDDLKEKIKQLQNVKIVEDAAVTPDGPIVEGVGVKMDARISTQINAFENRLREYLNSLSEEDLVKMSEADTGEVDSDETV